MEQKLNDVCMLESGGTYAGADWVSLQAFDTIYKQIAQQEIGRAENTRRGFG